MKVCEMQNELNKWKSRCASLTAEIAMIRMSITDVGDNELRVVWALFQEANRIRDEREKSIEKPVTLEVSSPAEG